jgi:hypothetical protein
MTRVRWGTRSNQRAVPGDRLLPEYIRQNHVMHPQAGTSHGIPVRERRRLQSRSRSLELGGMGRLGIHCPACPVFARIVIPDLGEDSKRESSAGSVQRLPSYEPAARPRAYEIG